MRLTKLEKYTKEFYWLSKKILELKSIEISNDVNDILEKNKNCVITIGYYDYDGFYYDETLDETTFNGKTLIEYLIEYYDNFNFNITCAIIIQFVEKEHTYYYEIEYNGYELDINITYPMYQAINKLKQQLDERGEQWNRLTWAMMYLSQYKQ